MTDIRENTKAIAEKLSEQFQLEGNQLTLKEGAYEATLPEGVDIKTVKTVHKHDTDFMHGFTLAAGEAAIKALNENKNLAHIDAETNVGVAKLSVNVKREGTVLIPPEKKGEPATQKTVVGQTSVRLGSVNGSEMKRVRAKISEAAKELFGG